MEFWPEFLASSWGREFIAGGVGGMAGVVAGHPLDTLRIHLQQPALARRSSSGSSSSVIGLVRRIHGVGGPLAFFKGMGAPLASVPFQNAVTFQTYALLSSWRMGEEEGKGSKYGRVAMAGFGAGLIQTSILTPVELVKIRLQLRGGSGGGGGSSRNSGGPLALARAIVAVEGVRGLYRGLGITILRDAPAHAIYFTSYEYVKDRLLQQHNKEKQKHNNGDGNWKLEEEAALPLWAMLTAGGVAGVASWVACYPLDVVKTRVQAASSAAGGGGELGVMECVRRSVAKEGLSVLWRGLGMAIARAYVVNAAIFSAYELSLRLLQQQQLQQPPLHSLPTSTST